MMKRFLLAALLCLYAIPALAQNPTCPTRPAGDATNACASTKFVNTSATNLSVTCSAGQFVNVVGAGTSACANPPVSNNLVGGALQTADTTLTSANCGQTLLIGSGYFTVTVGAASGFAANCVIVIVNNDSATAKKMAVNGITVGQSNRLWPLQSFVLTNQANVWFVTGLPSRWSVRSSQTIFVDNVNGASGNDGLASGAGRALATQNQAMTLIAQEWDLNANVTISSASGTNYSTGFQAQSYVGSGCITLEGNGSVIADSADFTLLRWPNVNGCWFFQNFDLRGTGTGQFMVFIDRTALVQMGPGMNFRHGTNAEGIVVTQNSNLLCNNNYQIDGNAAIHWDVEDSARIGCGSITITCVNTLNFSSEFAFAHGAGAILHVGGNTYAGTCGSATGKRYVANLIALIDAAGGSGSIPGNVAGSPAAGGTDAALVN